VIGKICDPRGQRVAGLLYYLYGPGRCEEHRDPHIVAGWRHPAELEPALRPDGSRDFRHLAGLLNQPHDALGARGFTRPVWHCSMRAAPEDKLLSDEEWAQVAADVMHRTGLSERGGEDDGVRWVVVRHGPDHVHVVAMLARQDGRKPRLDFERYKVRDACRAAEQEYGLRSTAPADRTAARRPARAETEKARRRGQDEAPRVTLRRHVATAAAGAGSQSEFFARLAEAGVQVRQRFSTASPGEVTGFAVTLPGDTTATGEPVWYGGGKLAPDLTWPKLRHRWQQAGSGSADPAGPDVTWEQAAQAAREAAAQVRDQAQAGPDEAGDTAWAAADTLYAAAAALGDPGLRQAADAFACAARPPHGRIPRPAPAGVSLRQTARLIRVLAAASGDPLPAALLLVIEIAALIDAVAELRAAQRCAAQAASARHAAELLHACRPAPAPVPDVLADLLPRVRTAADLARLGYPGGTAPLRRALDPQAPRPSEPDRYGPPPRRPKPPPYRGR
jgi:hypothetical protein